MSAIGKGGFRPAKIPVHRFDLPECGEEAYVWLRTLSARDLVDLRKRFGHEGSSDHLPFAYEVFARALSDDAGNRIFATAEEAMEGLELGVPTIEKLLKEILSRSGLGATEKN